MPYQLLADLVVAIHFAFVLFVVLGGLLVLEWRWVMWLHLPCALWGTVVELTGWVCPLTPLENWLRRQAGQSGYEGDFLARHLLAALYPAGLTRTTQAILGLLVVGLNVLIYWIVLTRHADR
jgi:hypothetical protein